MGVLDPVVGTPNPILGSGDKPIFGPGPQKPPKLKKTAGVKSPLDERASIQAKADKRRLAGRGRASTILADLGGTEEDTRISRRLLGS